MKPHNISGQRFGRVVATTVDHRDSKHSYWGYLCDCGNSGITTLNALRRGLVVSCGCFRKEFSAEKATTHGDCNSTEYRIWAAMKRRCDNPNRPEWPNYGGRGITYCDKWSEYEGFFADMGRRPKGGSLDRIDNDGGYCKENCRWATRNEQARNTRANRYIVLDGVKMLLQDACALKNISVSTVYRRIARGVPESEWLSKRTTPIR